MTFAPTAQQAAFLREVSGSSANLALIARAGCGKTSTILLAVDEIARAFPRAEVAVVAFNKSIADEVGAKLKAAGHTDWRKTQASTLHSLGWSLTRFAYKLSNDAIDDKKVRKLIELAAANSNHSDDSVFVQYGNQIEKLVSYAKDAGVGFFPRLAISDVGVWSDLAEHFDVNGFDDTSIIDDVIAGAQYIYKKSLDQTNVVDFSDMILFPLIKNLRVKFGKDFVILDEAQDLSAAKQALARKFVKRDGRMIVVGDDRQAIYGFSGADSEALPNLVKSLGATVLPLSVTFRCPKAVVKMAQTLVPDIEAAPSAPEGSVVRIPRLPEGGFNPTDAILCRNTAPLITTAYSLIRRGVPCRVEGRAIGDGLANLAKRWKVKTIAALLNKLEDYKAREVQKAQAKNNEAKAEEVEDRVQTLVEICNACIERDKPNVSDVIEAIQSLFADGVTGVLTLATYHRSKGREWPNVYLIEHALRCPSKAAKQQWQLDQEDNLAYVSFTRAQNSLIFVG